MFTRLESEQLDGPTVYTAEAEPLPHNFSPLPMPLSSVRGCLSSDDQLTTTGG